MIVLLCIFGPNVCGKVISHQLIENYIIFNKEGNLILNKSWWFQVNSIQSYSNFLFQTPGDKIVVTNWVFDVQYGKIKVFLQYALLSPPPPYFNVDVCNTSSHILYITVCEQPHIIYNCIFNIEGGGRGGALIREANLLCDDLLLKISPFEKCCQHILSPSVWTLTFHVQHCLLKRIEKILLNPVPLSW